MLAALFDDSLPGAGAGGEADGAGEEAEEHDEAQPDPLSARWGARQRELIAARRRTTTTTTTRLLRDRETN